MKIKLNESYYALLDEVKTGSNANELDRKFYVFVDALVEFSSNGQKIFSTYRVLSQIKADINLKKETLDLAVYDLYDRIIAHIEIETDITLLKLKNPELIDLDRDVAGGPPELLDWTDSKTDLIELIYGISKSINNGKAGMRKIVRCFEYFFQIKLGNFYDVLGDLNIRKGGPCQYLMKLPAVLLKKLDELNSK